MNAPPGYRVVAELLSDTSSRLLRVAREEDGAPFLLKSLVADYPSPAELARIKHEYNLLRDLAVPGVCRTVGILDVEGRPAMLLEDFDGESLDHILARKKRFTMEEFFRIAIGLTDILGGIHGANIIHKALTPTNILLNATTHELRVVEFGQAVVASQEDASIARSAILEGKLSFMAPEQTGRMNRQIDHRSDYYSLGVILYRILCGQLPFESDDDLELLHALIALRPVAPVERVPELSQVVSDLVMRLLEKDADSRYQSAWGIRHDLEECRRRHDQFVHIAPFKLGRYDRSDRFRLVQRLYGRDEQLGQLMGAFDRVCQGSREMSLVSGPAGIGKTALVLELYKPITVRRGFFISGKFNQLQRNNPYSAVVEALRGLIREILAEDEATLETWRKRLLEALRQNGQIIIDVIPEVASIIGTQPPVPPLGPVESQNRFERVFADFMRVFCRASHPMTIFLDDLQWADSASLALAELLMTDEHTSHFLMIGAYRVSEVGEGHPLAQTRRKLKSQGCRIEEVVLGRLEFEHVAELIDDSLRTGLQRAEPLARLVVEKTDGNPFFIGMFLKAIHTDGLLGFDRQALEWRWDLDRIREASTTDNVGDLLAARLDRYAVETRRLLQLAACIGSQFSLRQLATISQKEQTIVAEALRQPLEEGLFVSLNEAYKVQELPAERGDERHLVRYRFAHDRIQQAAYRAGGEEDREAAHLQIGIHLLASTAPERLEECIFDIVNQLDAATSLLDEQDQRDQLAWLNLTAARRARAAAAFGVAYDYLRTGLDLLGDGAWRRDYSLALTMYVEATEAAYLATRYEDMDALAAVVLREAKHLLDKVKVYEIQIDAEKARYRLHGAINMALPVLKLLGVSLPSEPGLFDLALAMADTRMAMGRKSIESIAELPEMTEPIVLARMRLITTLSSAAFFVKPELLPIPIFRAVKYSVQYGNAPSSASIYAAHGLVLCVMGRIEQGYRFGELALRLQDEYLAGDHEARTHEAKTHFLVYCFISHWKSHLRTTIDPLRKAFQDGMEAGDNEYASFCALWTCLHTLFCGKELMDVAATFRAYADTVRGLKQTMAYQNYCMYQQAVDNLLGGAEDPCLLVGEFFDETAKLPKILETEDFTTLFLYHIVKLMMQFLFQNFEQAVEHARKAEEYVDGAGSFYTVPLLRFYASMAYLAVYARSSPERQRRISKTVQKNQKYLRLCARHAPMNHAHRYHLVEAERLRVLGNKNDAMEHYAEAAALAREHGYTHEEALAHELAARFHLANEAMEPARRKLREALLCYQRWGAEAKSGQLELRYWNIMHADMARPDPVGSRQLDLESVLEAARTISEEIVLDRLLERLMKVVVHTAGAQRGFLLLETDGKLYIEAACGENGDGVDVLLGEPFMDTRRLSTSIVNWVLRSGEDVVVSHPAMDDRFSKRHDPYLQTRRPKSVLCLRVMRKAELCALLYLENNLTGSAFSEHSVAVLHYLTAQIAIALENARMFSNLEQSELRFRELYDNIADSVVLVDGSDRIVVANPSFYGMVGIPRREAGELTFSRWIHPDDREEVARHLWEPLEAGAEVRNAAFRLVGAGGTPYQVECSGRVIQRDGGRNEYQLVIRDVTERNRLQEKVIQSLKDVQNARSGIILGLAKLAEYRDTDTGAHLERMREFARVLAIDLRRVPKYREHITDAYIEDIYFSSPLHDIGKVGIPDHILCKRGTLTPEEREHMERHAEIGGKVIRAVEERVGHQSFLRVAMQVAECHHEKWDGSGYPKGLAGEEIPLSARIVALADVYDALTSQRIYKPAFSHQKSREIILEDSGTHFDPEVVAAFLNQEEQFQQIRAEFHDDAGVLLPE